MRRRTGSSGRRSQHGGMLVETAVAILIFSMVGTAVLSGISTGAISSRFIEEQSTMENIARNQMEYVLSQPYVVPGEPPVACTATKSGLPPTGYDMTCEVGEFAVGDPAVVVAGVALVTVTVQHGGASLVLQTVRAAP